jgi:hypothetical protein
MFTFNQHRSVYTFILPCKLSLSFMEIHVDQIFMQSYKEPFVNLSETVTLSFKNHCYHLVSLQYKYAVKCNHIEDQKFYSLFCLNSKNTVKGPCITMLICLSS